MFNNNYIDIPEKSSGTTPKSRGSPSNPDPDRNTVLDIIEYYKNHPSLIQIKEQFKHSNSSDFLKATVKAVTSIMQSLHTKKARGPDSIPIKVIKISSKVINSHACNIINIDLEKIRYSQERKRKNEKKRK